MDLVQSQIHIEVEPIYGIFLVFLGDELWGSWCIQKMDVDNIDTTVSSYESVTMLDIVSKSVPTWNKC